AKTREEDSSFLPAVHGGLLHRRAAPPAIAAPSVFRRVEISASARAVVAERLAEQAKNASKHHAIHSSPSTSGPTEGEHRRAASSCPLASCSQVWGAGPLRITSCRTSGLNLNQARQRCNEPEWLPAMSFSHRGLVHRLVESVPQGNR